MPAIVALGEILVDLVSRHTSTAGILYCLELYHWLIQRPGTIGAGAAASE